MKTDNIERYLNSFGKYIVQQAKTNLTKGKKNVSKDLYNSIRYKLVFTPKGFSVDFYMRDYGTFVDKGVSGKKNIQEFANYDNKKVASPYQYSNKLPPISKISKWTKDRGIKGRDSKGRFISAKSLAYLIAKKIQLQGIKSTSFFQRPIALAMQKFGVGLLNAVKEDVVTQFSKEIKTSIE